MRTGWSNQDLKKKKKTHIFSGFVNIFGQQYEHIKNYMSQIKFFLNNMFNHNFVCFFLQGNLGEVLIRCNNVLYIKGIDDEDEEGEMKD